jgi:hypothetical protein
VGSRLLHRSNEASFTFAMCMALALLCSWGSRKLGVGIRSSILGPPTTGQLATARLPPLPRTQREKREVCYSVDTGGREGF